jgi:hypothetical protein
LIEKVKQYRYLGVMFNASGSFSDAKEELYKRGLKALFKMYKCFEGHKMKIKTDQIIILIQREPQTKECLYY